MDEDTEKVIVTVLDEIYRAEQLLRKLDRNRVLSALELLMSIDTAALIEAVGNYQQTELDLRMARLRISALTGLQPEAIRSDPDRTPVEPLQSRKSSQIRIQLPKKPP